MHISLIRYHEFENVNTRLPETINKAQGVVPPLGLLYLANNLGHHKVTVIDAVLDNLTAEGLKQRLIEVSPDIVGITAMTPTIRGAFEAARVAKELGIPVVLGGPHLSVYPLETLDKWGIDYGIIGDGETPLHRLLDMLDSKDSYHIDGVITKADMDPTPFTETNLDDLRDVDWASVDLNRYNSIAGEGKNCTIIASRGCPFKCGFCFNDRRKVRFRNPSRVVAEARLLKKLGVDELLFYDDNVTLKKSYVEELCSGLKPLNIKWSGPSRIDTVTPRILTLMKDSGCHMLRFGVESGSDKILKLMNKGTTKDAVALTFHWAELAGLSTFAYFIIGYATETPETMQETIDFAIELNPDLVMFTTATPLPGTDLNRYASDPDYWLKYMNGETDERASFLVPEADKWTSKAYKEFYLRPGYVWKRLKSIRTIDDVSKNIKGALGVLRV